MKGAFIYEQLNNGIGHRGNYRFGKDPWSPIVKTKYQGC